MENLTWTDKGRVMRVAEEKTYRCSRGHQGKLFSRWSLRFSVGDESRDWQVCPLCLYDKLVALNIPNLEEVEEVKNALA